MRTFKRIRLRRLLPSRETSLCNLCVCVPVVIFCVRQHGEIEEKLQ